MSTCFLHFFFEGNPNKNLHNFHSAVGFCPLENLVVGLTQEIQLKIEVAKGFPDDVSFIIVTDLPVQKVTLETSQLLMMKFGSGKLKKIHVKEKNLWVKLQQDFSPPGNDHISPTIPPKALLSR